MAFLTKAHVDPDLTVELFLMDGPVTSTPSVHDGAGAEA